MTNKLTPQEMGKELVESSAVAGAVKREAQPPKTIGCFTKKEKFTQELLNTAEILEKLRVELLNLETFDDKLIKLVKLINVNNYRIEIQTIENNGICFAIKAKYGLTKYLKQIFTLWEKGIKKDTIIVYKDNTIMYQNQYYDKDYSIDDIIEVVELQQNNCYGTIV